MHLLNKKGILTLLAVLLICGVTFVPNSFADAAKAYFNFDSNNNPSASEGMVTFTLNGDGTIAASLIDFSSRIAGFGFDSARVNLLQSNFSPATPDNLYGWSDTYGLHQSGFGSYTTFPYNANVTVTWTIGNAGDFTSVLGALGGGNASHPFYLNDGNGEWAGDIGSSYLTGEDIGSVCVTGGTIGSYYLSSSSVPVPSALLLLGPGLAGLAVIRRRFGK